MKTLKIKTKSQAALSTFCWGIYMSLNGLGMVIFPNVALAAMGFEPTVEIWIRMVGLLSLVLGFYYVQMGRYQFSPFYLWKVVGHAGGILIMILFYFQDLISSNILMICLTDALAALWTVWGINEDRKKTLIAERA